MAATAFVGDGEFASADEGGLYLQRLWELYTWRKMRVHCPGRYFIPGGMGSKLRPEEVLEQLGSDCPAKACLIVEHEVAEDKRSEKKDAHLTVVFFPGGGGLLTYHKLQQAGLSFIHTLNTHSGLKRKLLALDLQEIWAQGEQFFLPSV